MSTSLCPTLGKVYAEKHRGVCPKHLQEPAGKTLKVSFIGSQPYIAYNPIRGSDFIVTNLLAKKFQFFPKYSPARSWGIVKENDTSYGMVHWVSLVEYSC